MSLVGLIAIMIDLRVYLHHCRADVIYSLLSLLLRCWIIGVRIQTERANSIRLMSLARMAFILRAADEFREFHYAPLYFVFFVVPCIDCCYSFGWWTLDQLAKKERFQPPMRPGFFPCVSRRCRLCQESSGISRILRGSPGFPDRSLLFVVAAAPALCRVGADC